MEAHTKRMEDDEAFQATRRGELLANHHAQWERDVQEKARFAKMLQEKDGFQKALLEKRDAEYREMEQQMRAEIAAQKAHAKQQRLVARKHEYVRRCREAEEMRIRVEREA